MKTLFLAYHRILYDGEDAGNIQAQERRYCVREGLLTRQMEYISDIGIKGASVERWVQSAGKDDGYIVLTFDDGNSNDFLAYQIFKRFNFSATFYIIAGRVNQKEYLTWEHLREMAGKGMEIGSHSLTHAYLPDLSRKELEYELKESKRILEDNLGVAINSFSVPWGGIPRDLRVIAEACGYKTICTSELGFNNEKSDMYKLKRIGVRNNMSFGSFVKAVNSNLLSLRIEDAVKKIIKCVLGRKIWLKCRDVAMQRLYKRVNT